MPILQVTHPAKVKEALALDSRALTSLPVGTLVFVTDSRTLEGSWERPGELGQTRVLCRPWGEQGGGGCWACGWASLLASDGTRLFARRDGEDFEAELEAISSQWD